MFFSSFADLGTGLQGGDKYLKRLFPQEL